MRTQATEEVSRPAPPPAVGSKAMLQGSCWGELGEGVNVPHCGVSLSPKCLNRRASIGGRSYRTTRQSDEEEGEEGGDARYVCVCESVCVHACVFVFKLVYLCVCASLFIYVCVCPSMHVLLNVSGCVDACTLTRNSVEC
jgi:hypothetical protein